MQVVKAAKAVAAVGLPMIARRSGKTMRSNLVGLPLALALIGTPAAAESMRATFMVTTSSTADSFDLLTFSGNPFLEDTDIRIRFVYDTDIGLLNDSGGIQTLYGGSDFGQPVNTQIVIYSLATYHFTGTQSSMVSTGPGFFSGSFSDHALGDSGLDISVSMLGANPASLTAAPFHKPVLTQDNAGTLTFTDGSGRHLQSNLRLVSFELAKGGIVPEAATWALMILGFAGVGGALRTRRHASRATSAVQLSAADHWL